MSQVVYGQRRLFVLGNNEAVRAAAAEFRYIGASVTLCTRVTDALAGLAREPDTMLIVSSDLPTEAVTIAVELAASIRQRSVFLGIAPGTDDELIRQAFRLGARAIVVLPLTADRLQRLLQTLPSAPVNEGRRLSQSPRYIGRLNATTDLVPSRVAPSNHGRTGVPESSGEVGTRHRQPRAECIQSRGIGPGHGGMRVVM
ncbi:hypothetical protein SAMN04489751_0948 [Brevibacterium sandarakinum]|uniref:Response regulatory domain-containing protein n=1 Tax=Brevibacterium sandarakinum TaxID=629680 RepID=A0A1H1NGM5_BRESA|nr:hypothetical protein SAMN04489751_0948 [Brevibacterium sandarakinum]